MSSLSQIPVIPDAVRRECAAPLIRDLPFALNALQIPCLQRIVKDAALRTG